MHPMHALPIEPAPAIRKAKAIGGNTADREGGGQLVPEFP